MREAAAAASMTRQGVWWRCRTCPGLAEAVEAARAVGREEREYRLHLRHPFLGMRPPASKMQLGWQPKYSYGRRG